MNYIAQILADLHIVQSVRPARLTFTLEDRWITVAARFGADALSEAAAIRFMELEPATAEAHARRVTGTIPDERQALCVFAAPLCSIRRDE